MTDVYGIICGERTENVEALVVGIHGLSGTLPAGVRSELAGLHPTKYGEAARTLVGLCAASVSNHPSQVRSGMGWVDTDRVVDALHDLLDDLPDIVRKAVVAKLVAKVLHD